MKSVAAALACVLSVGSPAWAGDVSQLVAPDTDLPRAPSLPQTAARPDVLAHPEPARQPSQAQPIRTCFSPAETREKVLTRRLREPFHLLRGAAGRLGGEALRAKLCRWNEDYVYEIALLRRDGRIVHVYLNAISGQMVGAFNDR